MMKMKSWNDHLSDAVLAAEQEGIPEKDVRELFNDYMGEYSPVEEDPEEGEY
jgi:hypothetical protein